MGKIANGILGGLSGKVGNIVGAQWKGIDYIRSKPDHVKNPRTIKQVEQRGKFKGVIEFAKMMKYPVIIPCWNKTATKMSGTNMFVKNNIGAFNAEGKIEDYDKILLTIGKSPVPEEVQIHQPESANAPLVIDWTYDTTLEAGHGEDVLSMIVFTKGEFRGRCIQNFADRKETRAEMIIEGDYVDGDELDIFFFFTDNTYNNFSKSVHKNIVIKHEEL